MNSYSLSKIVIIENARFNLGVNVTLQLDFSKKVKGKTKRGRQKDKRTGTDRETYNKYFH